MLEDFNNIIRYLQIEFIVTSIIVKEAQRTTINNNKCNFYIYVCNCEFDL